MSYVKRHKIVLKIYSNYIKTKVSININLSIKYI